MQKGYILREGEMEGGREARKESSRKRWREGGKERGEGRRGKEGRTGEERRGSCEMSKKSTCSHVDVHDTTVGDDACMWMSGKFSRGINQFSYIV